MTVTPGDRRTESGLQTRSTSPVPPETVGLNGRFGVHARAPRTRILDIDPVLEIRA